MLEVRKIDRHETMRIWRSYQYKVWVNCLRRFMYGISGATAQGSSSPTSFYYRVMTNAKEKLELILDNVLGMGEMVCKQFEHITCTTRAALLLSLSSSLKQTEYVVGNVRSEILEGLIDVYGVDYKDYQSKFVRLSNLVDTKILLPLSMVTRDGYHEIETTDTNSIISKENDIYKMNEYDLAQRADYIRTVLFDGSEELLKTIKEDLDLIKADLKGINDDRIRLINHPEELQPYYDEYGKCYRERNESEVLDELEVTLNTYKLTYPVHKDACDVYLRVFMKDVSSLTCDYVNGENAALYILKSRDSISRRELDEHFREVIVYEYLTDGNTRKSGSSVGITEAATKRVPATNVEIPDDPAPYNEKKREAAIRCIKKAYQSINLGTDNQKLGIMLKVVIDHKVLPEIKHMNQQAEFADVLISLSLIQKEEKIKIKNAISQKLSKWRKEFNLTAPNEPIKYGAWSETYPDRKECKDFADKYFSRSFPYPKS